MNYIQSYLDNKVDEDAIEKNTYISYGGDLKRFFKYFKEHKNMNQEDVINNISSLDVDEFKKWMAFNEEEKYAISTINRTLDKVREFNDYLIYKKITTNNFMEGVKKIKYNPKNSKMKKKKVKDTISKDEFNILMKTCEEGYKGMKYKWFNSPRNKFILSFMFSTGARISEVLNIKLNMISYSCGAPFVTFSDLDTKADIPKSIPICGKTLEFYKEYLEQRKKIKIIDEGYLILSPKGRKLDKGNVNDFLDKLCEECNIKKHITNHCFRKLFSSVGNILGISPVIINVIGGWSNKGVMQYMYAENGITDEAKLKAVEDIQNFLFE